MHPVDIRSALKKAGYTAVRVADELGITSGGVRQVMDGATRSIRIEERISEITDIPLYRLWPQWHAPPDGAPAEFDPTKLSFELLEAIERSLADELQRRVPGLIAPFTVRARHRAAIYNACVARGAQAIETQAGTSDEVRRYLDAWRENFEAATEGKATPEALRKWALNEAATAASSDKGSVSASGGSIASGGNTTIKVKGSRR